MNLVEYKNIALQRLNKSIAENPKESMNYSCMGLIEETGEIIAELRKPLFKGNFHQKTLDIPSIKSELGDLMWYIALICRDYNVDISELENNEISEDNIQLTKREKLIKASINMGKSTGQIVGECIKIYKCNNDNEKLIEKMKEQYANINELVGLLDITIEEVLDENIKKINSRYTEKGDVNR